MTNRYVSLLPAKVEEQLARRMVEGFTGSFTIHVQDGNVRTVEVKETVKVG